MLRLPIAETLEQPIFAPFDRPIAILGTQAYGVESFSRKLDIDRAQHRVNAIVFER
jgi:hypothetical protein